MTGGNPPLLTLDPAAVREIRALLDARAYAPAAVRAALGSAGEILARPSDLPGQLRRLEAAGELGSLVKLFVLGVPVPAAEAARALHPLAVERLAGLGVVGSDDGRVVPLVAIVPHEGIVVASDPRAAPGIPAPPDSVPGVQRPSQTLALLTVRRPVARTLDLGTGCGVQALFASKHSAHVVATDVNPRATRFAAFNALLNGADNVEVRTGSWFAPVGAETFDLIVSNPPYVISPDTEYIYRDSGMPGDTVSEQVTRQAAAHLTEGGFATVMVSWVSDPAGDVFAAPRRWVEGCGCDAWLLHYRTDDPLTNAIAWCDPQTADAATVDAALDRWLAYYSRSGIRAISYGAIVLRRRAGAPNWTRTAPLPPGSIQQSSEHILRVFAAHDALADVPDDRMLLDRRFAVVPKHRLTQRLRLTDGRLVLEEVSLELREGLGFEVGLDQYAADLVQRLGVGTVREALRASATTFGVPDRELERFEGAGLPIVRRLVELGLAVPA